MRRTFTFISVLALMMSMLAILPALANTASTPVSDGGVTPYIIAGENPGGNRTCAEVGMAFGATFEHSSDRVNYNGGFSGAFPTGLTVDTDGNYVSFSSTFAIGAVIVKGSNEANVYYYNPARLSDSGLAAPGSAGLSNLTFCWNAPPIFPEGTLAVEKTARGDFDRTVTWDIDKSVDPDHHRLLVGGSAVSDYEVDVTKIDSGPGNYRVSGSILISWSGSDVPVTITSIEDSIDGAVITYPATWDDTILPGSSITCLYTAPGDPDVTDNTVDVEGEYVIPVGFQDAGDTVPVDNSDTSPTFTYEENLTGFDMVKVFDAFNNGPAVELVGSPINISDLFEYDRTFVCEERGTTSYPDTASIFGVDPEGGPDTFLDDDDALVTVECVAALEACTPGFWGGTRNSPYTPANQPAWDYLGTLGIDVDDEFADSGRTYNQLFNTQGRGNYSGSLDWHAAAAYLNAVMADAGFLDFPYTAEQILDLYDEGADKDVFAHANEDGQCPFGANFDFSLTD